MSDLLNRDISNTALAYRGYNLTNLGRSGELLMHPVYGPLVKKYLDEASAVCADLTGTRVHLAGRIRRGHEASMKKYAEAVSLIVAMEMAQLALLEEHFGVRVQDAKLAFGFSLGELTAVANGGMFQLDQILKVPVAMAEDCIALARDVKMGVLFSRGPALNLEDVQRLCLRINVEGQGTIGVSSILSPNTALLLGQGKTVQSFKAMMHELLPREVHLRENASRWPPMHTPIVWQRNVPNRAAVMMHTMQGGVSVPKPAVLSMVTGKFSYNDYNWRDILHQWVDHPQRLWDVICETLASGVTTIIHVGPAPNLIPATFKRLSDNVQEQVSGRSLGSLGLRAVSSMSDRRWLGGLLPTRTALLRAPKLKHIILEDWLLSHQPK